jgi:prepilin-type N-terminal cleavage/methylation domain-containing protein
MERALNRHCHRSRAAFTLVELLVATAVVAVFLVLSVNMATDTLRRSETVNSQLRANLQARLVMDWITRDIQSALVRSDGGEWLRMEPSALEANGLNLPFCKLMLFSQAGENHLSGNAALHGPAAVAYEAAYVDPITLNPATRRQTALFRLALDPAFTFAAGFSENIPANLGTDLWNVLPPETGVVMPQNVLIQNLAGFQVGFEFLTANGTTIKSPATETFSAGVNGAVRVGAGAGAMEYPDARVLAAEVTIWLLDPSGIRALKQGGLPLDELFEKHARPFVRRIAIRSP